jgi:hypothetical protein
MLAVVKAHGAAPMERSKTRNISPTVMLAGGRERL